MQFCKAQSLSAAVLKGRKLHSALHLLVLQSMGGHNQLSQRTRPDVAFPVHCSTSLSVSILHVLVTTQNAFVVFASVHTPLCGVRNRDTWKLLLAHVG